MSQRSETRHKIDAMSAVGIRKGTDTDIYTEGVVCLKVMCTSYKLRRV